MKNSKFILLPFILWIVVIFTISSIPAPKIPQGYIPQIDKGVHLFEYLVLSVFYLFGTKGKYKGWGLLIILVVAIIDEYHQRFIPGRDASMLDAFADILGGGFGIWMLKG